MGRRIGRFAIAAFLPLVAACGTDPSAAKNRFGEPGQRSPAERGLQGIRPDSIVFSAITVDTGPADRSTPEWAGDQAAVLRTVVDTVNAQGGVGGRKVELHVYAIPADPTTGEGGAACRRSTEVDMPFAVLLGSMVPAKVARCVALHHSSLTIAVDGYAADVYEAGAGRMFSLGAGSSMSVERTFTAWARTVADVGALDGRRVGVVTTEFDPGVTAAVDKFLVPELARRGHRPAVTAVLPCPQFDNPSCAQHAPSAQRMKDAGVDMVFLAAGSLAAPTFVKAAADAGWSPAWTATGPLVVPPGVRLFDGVRAPLQGAIGVTSVFPGPTPEAAACRDLLSRAGIVHPIGTEAARQSASTCVLVQQFVRAAAAAGPEVDQDSLVEALEAPGAVPSSTGPPGSLSQDKHDAADHVHVTRYDAVTGLFVAADLTPRKVG